MTSMRLRLKLRGLRLLDPTYTWAGEGRTCIFVEDSITLLSSLHYREYIHHTSGSIPGTETLILTDEIIFPNIVKPIAIIDGTVRGQLKYKYYIDPDISTPSGKLWITKIVITLFKVDSDNNETEITSYTVQIDVYTEATTEQELAFLYFFHVNNEKLLSTERLMMKFALYGKHTDKTNTPYGHYYSMATINTDERSIDIPIV